MASDGSKAIRGTRTTPLPTASSSGGRLRRGQGGDGREGLSLLEEDAAEEDKLIRGLDRAGLVAHRVEDHRVSALQADQEAATSVVAIAEEHARDLDEVAVDELLG